MKKKTKLLIWQIETNLIGFMFLLASFLARPYSKTLTTMLAIFGIIAFAASMTFMIAKWMAK